jgi:lipopolysaccharide/colanic/teichoic acid biosynthesis glycosyltransferase
MYKLAKRSLDFIVSLIAIFLLLPFLLPICIVLRCTAEGEIFYLQERMGFKNHKFKIFKFATMLKDSLSLGTGSITLTGDFRITRIGKYLRSTKINELPQLYNILKGDISIVGPRPVLEQDWLLYPDTIRDKIYDVKPGLTGIGSIIFRDEESIISKINDEDPHIYFKRVIAPFKGKLEMWYQEHRSFLLDFKLILMTAWVILVPTTKLYENWFKDLPKRNF